MYPLTVLTRSNVPVFIAKKKNEHLSFMFMCPTQSVDSKPDPPDLSSNSDTPSVSVSKTPKSGATAKTNVSVASVCNVKTSTVLPTAMVDVIDSSECKSLKVRALF